MTGHVIVCGAGRIAVRVVEQLTALGLDTRTVHTQRETVRAALVDAGLDGARAVVCAEERDLDTLELALLVRDMRPDVRVVVHLDNPAVGRAVEDVTGEGSVLDVAELFAPSVVDACAGRTDREVTLGDESFVAIEVVAPRAASLRELYGDLAPIGVVDASDDVIVCPGRDVVVAEGDRVTVLGTRAQIADAGLLRVEAASAAAPAGRRALRGLIRTVAGIRDATDRAVQLTVALSFVLAIVATLVLHAWYRKPDGHGMDFLQALYFTMETAATVGFGDYSFANQSAGMQVFGIALIASGTIVVSTLFALVTNALVANRIEQSLGRGRLRGIRGHVVVVGLGAIGMRVLEGIVHAGREAVVVERDENNRHIAQARALGVPVVIGDATLGPTLEAVHLSSAAAVAIMTSDDLVNLETGLAVRDRLGERWAPVPVVLRVFDRVLARRLEHSFGFRHVWSTEAIAAPWFVGSAVGFGVLSTFYVGNVPFLVARLPLRKGGGLEDVPMRYLSARIRVIALGRADGRLEHPPRRDTRFAPGDVAYLVGPYEELLAVVRQEGVAVTAA